MDTTPNQTAETSSSLMTYPRCLSRLSACEVVSTFVSFTGRDSVSIDDLNIRKGAGTNTEKTGAYTGVGVFTIVEVKDGKGSDTGWGKLKSGAGWISLDYCTRV